jgi:hypothetical protein
MVEVVKIYVYFRDIDEKEILSIDPDIDFVLLLFLEDNWANLFSSNIGFEPFAGI